MLDTVHLQPFDVPTNLDSEGANHVWINVIPAADKVYLFATVPISRTNTYAQTGLMVYFLLGNIKNRSVIRIIICHYNYHTQW